MAERKLLRTKRLVLVAARLRWAFGDVSGSMIIKLGGISLGMGVILFNVTISGSVMEFLLFWEEQQIVLPQRWLWLLLS